jgi:subtilisin family serine protease
MDLFSLNLADLDQSNGQGVRVAIVDSGVHATHPHVNGVAGGVGIDAAGLEHGDYVDRLGHGTAVAAVIKEKAPAADVFAIKVFDRELNTTGPALVAALQWARRRDMRLVNLSLGTTNTAYEAALLAEVNAASEAGLLVVAAGPQPDTRWLPGSLPGVIAVSVDMTMPRDVCTCEISGDGRVAMTASGYPRPIPGVPPERNLTGLSFAVANASGLLVRMLEGVSRGDNFAAALGAIVKSTSSSG